MRTNRKNRSGSVRVGLVCLAVWVCCFLCLSGLGYIWHRNRNAQLSRELHKRAAHLELVRMQNQQLDRVLAELQSPRALQAGIQKWRLDLVIPEQVLPVTDPGPGKAAAGDGTINLADGCRGQ